MLGHIPKDISSYRLAHILDSGKHYDAFITKKTKNKGSVHFIITLTTFQDKGSMHDNSSYNIKDISTKPAKKHCLLNKTFFSISNLEAHFRKANNITGIYCIWDSNYKTYVGQSKNIGVRWRKHYNELLGGKHKNKALQQAWSKLGENCFRFDVVEETCTELDEKEKLYIKKSNSFLSGYNRTIDGQKSEVFSFSVSEEKEDGDEVNTNVFGSFNQATKLEIKEKDRLDDEAVSLKRKNIEYDKGVEEKIIFDRFIKKIELEVESRAIASIQNDRAK